MAGVIFDGKTVAPAIVVEKEPSTLDPLWPDIEKLLEEKRPAEMPADKGYAIGLIVYGFDDEFDASVSGSLGVIPSWIITSDGYEYDWNGEQSGATHVWDKTKDIIDSEGLPVRYILAYSNLSYNSFLAYNFFSASDYGVAAYIYFKGAFTYKGSNAFAYHTLLRGIKIEGNLTCESGTGLLSDATFLTSVPDNLYVTNTSASGLNYLPFAGTSISDIPLDRVAPTNDTITFDISSCGELPRAVVLPEFVMKLNFTSLYGMGNGNWESLVKIPDGWDLSNCTNFDRTNNFSELRYAGTVDMSANETTFRSTRSGFNCYELIDIKCTLPNNTNVWFDASTKINIESFRFMADHAPDVTATPRTLTVGSTNLSRINAADPTIITDLNAKGWTVA